MLTPLQSQKITLLFRSFDADANGFVEKDDYLTLTANFAAIAVGQPALPSTGSSRGSSLPAGRRCAPSRIGTTMVG